MNNTVLEYRKQLKENNTSLLAIDLFVVGTKIDLIKHFSEVDNTQIDNLVDSDVNPLLYSFELNFKAMSNKFNDSDILFVTIGNMHDVINSVQLYKPLETNLINIINIRLDLAVDMVDIYQILGDLEIDRDIIIEMSQTIRCLGCFFEGLKQEFIQINNGFECSECGTEIKSI